MRVLALNGSPHKCGNCYAAIETAASEIRAAGIEVDVINVGGRRTHGCLACGACQKPGVTVCALADDWFRGVVEQIIAADGLILASPVYVGGINGNYKAFLDRMLYPLVGTHLLDYKVGAGIAVAQTAGSLSTLNQLTDYFLAGNIVTVPSTYWTVGKGIEGAVVFKENEMLVSAIRQMGRNMAWLLKMIDATRDTIPLPSQD